jgi:hypothetical protein
MKCRLLGGQGGRVYSLHRCICQHLRQLCRLQELWREYHEHRDSDGEVLHAIWLSLRVRAAQQPGTAPAPLTPHSAERLSSSSRIRLPMHRSPPTYEHQIRAAGLGNGADATQHRHTVGAARLQPAHDATPEVQNGQSCFTQSSARYSISGAEAVVVDIAIGALPVSAQDSEPQASPEPERQQQCFQLDMSDLGGAHDWRWAQDTCDHCAGDWRCYFLLWSDGAAMEDGEVQFPNKVAHGGRMLFNATPPRILRFLADTTPEEVRLRHCSTASFAG